MESTVQRRVLVVDDDPLITDLLGRRLRADGYVVEGVNNPQAARERLEQGVVTEDGARAVDMVLLDVDMPVINGFDLLQEIRKTRTAIELPIIMVTGRNETDDLVSALDSAANDFVTKPIDFPVLLARMRTHLALKEAHEQLRNSHRSLIHAAKMESVVHFAGGFAQEIRRPLAQVRMGLNNLKPAMGDGEDSASSLLENMEDSLKQADGIVSQLISSSSANRLQMAPVDLAEFADEMLKLMAEALEEAQVNCELKVENTRPMALMASEEMKQVFVNVALNAIQATSAEGKIIVRVGERKVGASAANLEGSRIGARLHAGDAAAAFEIEDSGAGLNEEELQSVFDPFFKGRSSGSGAGLGLTVAKRMVELHGGIITVENKSFGSGAKVSVLLRQKPPVRV